MIGLLVRKNKIGIAILLLLFAIPSVSYALCQVTLQWDPNAPSPDGYLVFCRQEGQSYDYDDPIWQGGDDTITHCTIDNLEEDKTYFFVVRAYVGYDESGDSNEVRFSYASSGSSSSLSGINTTGTASASGGGSGAGCFINSLLGLSQE